MRWGTISEFDDQKYLAKVDFQEDNIVSGWLMIISRGSQDTKDEFPFDKGELVCCLTDEFMERGVVIGSSFNETDTPDAKSKDKYQVKYSDGTIVQYDRSAHKQSWKLSTTELILTQNGYTIKRGSESLKTIISDLIDKILLLTVTTPNGPSGTPINAAEFSAIKSRLPNLFEA